MKRKLLILVTITCLFMIYVVTQSVVSGRPANVAQEIVESLERDGCSDKSSRAEVLSRSKFHQIRRLGELESKCNSQAASELVYAISIPENDTAAKELASRTAELIVENNNYDLTPILLLSPDVDWKPADFADLVKGSYDKYLTTFFTELRLLGVTDSATVKWVLLPNANLPLWNNTNIPPADFISIYNSVSDLIKESYQNAQIGLVLNSSTYESAPFNWADKEYLPFEQYLKDIKKENISFFGVEALPWMPSLKTKAETLFSPREYLSVKNAISAADYVGTNTVYVFTGTFATMYTKEQEKTTKVPADMRKTILEEVLKELTALKANDKKVVLVISAEDNSLKSEQTDWSYWGSSYTENPNHEAALLGILREARRLDISTGFKF